MRPRSPKTRRNRDLYAEYKRLLWVRSQGRCERCGAMAHDAHHARKPRRSFHHLIIALCRKDHEWLDAPLTGKRGRLVITVEEGDPMIVTFRIRGGPEDGACQTRVLPALSLPEEGR